MGTEAEQVDGGSSGRLSHQGHVARVAIELPDVLLYPVECHGHIPEEEIPLATVVSRRPHAQVAQSVLQSHKDHTLLTLKMGSRVSD